MEEDREEITHEAQRTGATEQEARVLHHLKEIGRLFSELPGMTDVDLTTINQYITAMTRVVAARVAERDHPEGWFFSREDEKQDA